MQSNLTSAAAKCKKHVKQLGANDVAPKSADMPAKADVIMTEIFDSQLLGEGILPTMQHTVKHLLQVCCHPITLATDATSLMQALQCQPKCAAVAVSPQMVHVAFCMCKPCVPHVHSTSAWASMFVDACALSMQQITRPLQKVETSLRFNCILLYTFSDCLLTSYFISQCNYVPSAGNIVIVKGANTMPIAMRLHDQTTLQADHV